MKCGVLIAIEKKEAKRIGMYIYCYHGSGNNGLYYVCAKFHGLTHCHCQDISGNNNNTEYSLGLHRWLS